MTRSPAAGAAEHPFAHLAEHLTALRRTARLPQRALAQAANISRGAVQRAESGTAAPTAAVLDAYLRACGAGEAAAARARLLRTRGRTAHRDKLRELKAPAPDFIHDKRDLGLALAEAYEQAGAPPLRELSLPGRAPLPVTTAWRIVHRKGLPATVRQMLTFLTACGISPTGQRPYIAAYHRVTAGLDARPTRPPARRRASRIGPIRIVAEGHTEEHVLPGPAAAPARTIPAGILEEAFTTALHHWASREAHRNGTAPPDWITTTSFLSHGVDLNRDRGFLTARTTDSGIDLIARNPDSGTALIQIKSQQQRPGPAPALPGTRVPEPPSPTPADHAA